jgi:hypothetical protein
LLPCSFFSEGGDALFPAVAQQKPAEPRPSIDFFEAYSRIAALGLVSQLLDGLAKDDESSKRQAFLALSTYCQTYGVCLPVLLCFGGFEDELLALIKDHFIKE